MTATVDETLEAGRATACGQQAGHAAPPSRPTSPGQDGTRHSLPWLEGRDRGLPSTAGVNGCHVQGRPREAPSERAGRGQRRRNVLGTKLRSTTQEHSGGARCAHPDMFCAHPLTCNFSLQIDLKKKQNTSSTVTAIEEHAFQELPVALHSLHMLLRGTDQDRHQHRSGILPSLPVPLPPAWQEAQCLKVVAGELFPG